MSRPNKFIPGLMLGRLFHEEIVQPILEDVFPNLPYTAALIGSGSEILGFDTQMSTDHHWGPRLMMFLLQADFDAHAERIKTVMSERLPYNFRGYSTHFTPPNPADAGNQLLSDIDSGPVNHRIEIDTLKDYCGWYLGIDPADDLTPQEWLTIPSQKLRTMTAGAIYHDGIGELTRLREKLAYYPYDIWVYLMAALWSDIGQEEHLMGRAGYVDGELGSRLLAARLVHKLMNLCFLMERQYAPYSKWFGFAFKQLDGALQLTPILHAVLSAETWQERDQQLAQAYSIVAEKHNALQITEPLATQTESFFGRPFQVIWGDRFAAALIEQIQNDDVKRIAQRTQMGSVEQFSTSTNLLEDVPLMQQLRLLYP